MQPEWNDLKVLLAVARAGTIAGAAKELGVDQSTVSRRLSTLEEVVGTQLAIRGRRRLRLTDEGSLIEAAAEIMHDAALTAVRSIQMAKAAIDGTVRVSVSPGYVPLLMQLVLPPLRARYPLLSVELTGGFQRADLAEGEADMAVRMARPTEHDLVARKAFEQGWFAYGSEDYLKAHGMPGSPLDLARHHLILYVESMHVASPLRWMEDHCSAETQTSRVDNIEIACQAIAKDNGIAILPCFLGDAEPNLRRVFPDPVDSNSGWIVYHESARGTARVRVVVDALVAFFSHHRRVFAGTDPAAAMAC